MLITNMTFNGLIQSKLAHSRSITKMCALTPKHGKIRFNECVKPSFRERSEEYNGKYIFSCDMCENQKKCNKGK